MVTDRILVVDDEPGTRFGISGFLEASGYGVETADGCRAAEESFRAARFDAAVLDYSLPDCNALELLPRLRGIDPTVPVVILTAHATIDLAVRAIQEGAEHFLTKPVELPALQTVLERVLAARRARRRQVAGRARQDRSRLEPFVGPSPAIRRLAEEARRVAASDAPILIQGESGTGKGVLAAWLHRHSPRAEEPCVDLNCAGLGRELLESELFGHEKGAFTGAVAGKTGLLELAHRGTVFLDEIGDMDPLVQPKVLTVLEEKRFRRLGDVRDRQVDIRLIAATHQDLAALVRDGRFRNDLFFRINAIPLAVPALRERVEDIPPLAERLLRHIVTEQGRGGLALAKDAIDALVEHPWPGNIRELRNVLERAALMSRGREITGGDLRFDSGTGEEDRADRGGTLYDVQRRHVERVLREEAWRVDRAARRLDVPRSSLYQRIKRYGIVLPRGGRRPQSP
jgi:DNA-binding NtrC family response regulator